MPYNSLIGRGDMGGLIPVERSREIIQGAIGKSVVLSLGRRLRDMPSATRTLPVMSALPVAYFVSGDNGLKQTTEVNWEGLTLTAEEVAVIVPIPQAALDDSAFPIWDEIQPSLEEAAGRAIDQAVLFGTNKPSSWPTAIYTAAVAAGNSLTALSGSPATDLYDNILGVGGVVGMVEADGFMVTGHVADVSLRARLRGLRDTTGQPIFLRSLQTDARYELDGEPVLFPRNGSMVPGTALLFCGDWDHLVYAWRQDINYMVADQGVIQDSGGNIVYNLFQQDMVALRMTLRLAVQLPNPVTALNSASTRYPFAVLKP